MRLIVSVASSVCSVLRTRCPVSAAESAIWALSESRISPIRMMSGSWRSTLLSARAYDSVSVPTSRWLMMHFSSRCRNSMGSSMVMMCLGAVRLTMLIIDANVVDLPLPVVPVTRMIPRSSLDSVAMASGRFRSSNLGTPNGINRITIETDPRCPNALTLNRPIPRTAYEKSASPLSSNSFNSFSDMMSRMMFSVSTGRSTS